jgi:hypothetical protein
MAISIDLGSGAGSTNGDTLFAAFTKVNNMFSTTTKLGNGDLEVNGIRIGKGNNSIGQSTALGVYALNSQALGSFDNTAIGYTALTNNSSGYMNTAVGTNSMASNTIGGNNTAVGSNALLSNSEGSVNVAIGGLALEKNTYGNNNTAVGGGALNKNTLGDYNTAIGRSTLTLNTEGDFNVAIGGLALSKNTYGISNVSIGTGSMTDITIGSYNTGVGVDTLDIGNWNYATALGYNAKVTGDSQIQLGSGTTTCYTNGVLQNRSDLRDKAEVRDTVLGLDFVNSLRAVDYKWDMREDYRSEKPSYLNNNATDEEKEAHKIAMDEWLEASKLDNITHDGTHTRTRYHHGLIAQEVQDVINASGVDFGGFQDHSVNGGNDVLSLGYTELIAPMIKAIQELTARINVLEGN